MAKSSVYRDGAKLRTRQRLLPAAERQRRFDKAIFLLAYRHGLRASEDYL
jgi:hypothetical protein